MALYHATFYPDTFGNGDYDGRGTFAPRDMTVGETYSFNKNDLARRMKDVGRKTTFNYYPIILAIKEQDARQELRFRLKSEGSRWEKVL